MRAPRVTLCLGFSRRFFFKISDKKTKALTADEKFFQQHDTDPTLDFIESLERERALLEEKEKQAEQTEEWKEYDREVEAVIYELEHEWLTDPRPISKDSVKHARLVMEAAVKKVQKKHELLNDMRIEAYTRYKQAALVDGRPKDGTVPEMPVSEEYARLLDKFK